MTSSAPKSSVETFTSDVKETIKINSLDELKKEFGVEKIQGIEEEFKKPLITSKKELLKMKEEFTKNETSNKLKEFLEGKGVFESIGEKYKNFKESIKPKEILEKSQNGLEETGKKLEEAFDKTGNSELGKKAKVAFDSAKEKASELGEKAFWERLENIPLIGGIFSFFKKIFDGIKGFFSFGEKLNGAKEKLKPEEIEKTKAETKKYILDKFGTTLTEENKEKLGKQIDNLSKEQITNLSKEIKEGNLNFITIGNIIPNIYKEFLKEEQINIIKEKAKFNIEKAIVNDIKEKYGVDIEGNKLVKLQGLIKENTTLSDETIGELIEVEKNKKLLIKDLFGPFLEGAINSTSLFIGLISNGIVPAKEVGMNFVESSSDVVKLSASALGISQAVNLEMFHKTYENMGETEKAIMIGLLYRKGGLFLNLIGSLGEAVSRIGIESLTKTEVKSLDLNKNAILGKYDKQIESFEKIAKNLDPKGYKGNVAQLINAKENLLKVSENYKIINILSQSNGNTEKAIQGLKSLNFKIPDHINSNSSIDDLAKAIRTNSNLMQISVPEKLHGNLGFGKTTDLYRLNEKINKVLSAQNMMLEGNALSKSIGKIKELAHIGEISRLGDRMTLHFESVDDAKKGIKSLNVLANKFPDLIKGTLDKLPIIAIGGLAASSDKPFFEELKTQMNYLFPIVGPIMMVKDSGINWGNGEIKGENITELGIAGVLLTIDSVFLTKELATNGLKGGAKYMVKPIADIYSLGRGTLEGAHNIGKAAINGKSLSAVTKEAVNMTKNIKSPKLRTIAILLGVGGLSLSYALADDSLEEVFSENGKLNPEKLKQEIENLNDEEKLVCLNYLLAQKYGEEILKDIKLNISDNKINILSGNKNIQSEWIIRPYMIEDLDLNPKIEFEYKEKAA